MMSSMMPSAKYSCSGSPLMFVNGRTAIDGLVGQRERRRAAAGRRPVERDPVHPHRPLDVLDGCSPRRLEAAVQLALQVVVSTCRDADAAGLGQASSRAATFTPSP